MCGILGGLALHRLEWLDAEPDRLDAAIDRLAHRGPDDRGAYVSPDRRAFLGHRRLSIIDLDGGHQPIADATGRRRLTYNGEIYNYRGLRDSLQARGVVFATRTDGEPALHLYVHDRERFVESLHGMFALAILDETDGSLTMARDRNGIKPLYYYASDDCVLFASELKSILALLPRPPALSGTGLRQYLRWKYIPAPLTIYESIRQLPPGHRLRVTRDEAAGKLRLDFRPYWELDYGGEKLTGEREALELLDQKLRAAVESHLESDVEVGALLSGGVDSSLVVALASTISGKRIKTFSVGFREAGFDQLPYARRLAETYQTEHHEEIVALDPVAAVERMVRQFDEPFADSSALACLRVCEVACRHVKVALTGDGGDETFAGYKRYDDLRARARPISGWRRAANRAVIGASTRLLSPEAKFLKRLRGQVADPFRQHEQRQMLCTPWLANWLLTEPYRRDDGDPDVFDEHRRHALARGWTPVEVAQYVDLRMYLPGDILTKVDRTSMACSLECRVPLLDHSITEFAATLSDDLKVRGGVRKYLLKRLAERYVPRELLYRPKMGFRVPIRRWFKGDLLDRTGDLLLDGVLTARGVLDPAGVRWTLRRQRLPWIDLATPLWALLFLEHWARAYLTD